MMNHETDLDSKRMESMRMLDNTIRSYREQRYDLELMLETAPRNSRYSNSLVNLMQREELSLREGRHCVDLSREVEAALANETRAFFSKIAQSNIKKWQTMVAKHQREKDELIQLVRDKCRIHFSDNYLNSGKKHRDITPIDLEVEAVRLEMEYNKHWYEIESFHINEAFKSQKERIDVEWGTHLDNLNEAYDKKIRTLTGDDTSDNQPTKTNLSNSGRWHNAEKQKTLIHTAPVLSPTTTATATAAAAGSGVRAVRKKVKENSASKAEFERIERQHKSMVDSLLTQKANAVRWMRHQETRLVSQNQETHSCRQPIATLLEVELSLLNNFRSLITPTPHSTTNR